MADPKSNVYGGREGSGLAQVFDTSRIVNFYQGVQNQRNARELELLKRRNKALETAKKDLDKMATPSYLHEQEFFKFSRDWREKYAEAIKDNPESIYDPTSSASIIRREGVKAEELFASQSKFIEEQYNLLKKNLNNPEYDQQTIVDTLKKLNDAKTIKDQYEVVQNGLVPSLNEWDILKELDVSTFTNSIEGEDGVTIKGVNVDDNDLISQVTGFFTTEKGRKHLQSGINKGTWSDIDSAIDWVVDNAKTRVNESYTVRRDSEKGGLNLNFAGGGGSMENNGWTITPFSEKDYSANKYTSRALTASDNYGFTVARKGLNSPAVVLNSGENEADGTAIDERGYITSIVVNPDNPDKSFIKMKVASKQGQMDASTEELDKLPTTEVPLNDENKAKLKALMGFDVDEAVKNLKKQKGQSKPKQEESTKASPTQKEDNSQGVVEGFGEFER